MRPKNVCRVSLTLSFYLHFCVSLRLAFIFSGNSDLLFPETDELEHNKSINLETSAELCAEWAMRVRVNELYRGNGEIIWCLSLVLCTKTHTYSHTQTNKQTQRKKSERCNFLRSKEGCWLLKLSVCLPTFTFGIKSSVSQSITETCSFENVWHTFLVAAFAKEATEK